MGSLFIHLYSNHFPANTTLLPTNPLEFPFISLVDCICRLGIFNLNWNLSICLCHVHLASAISPSIAHSCAWSSCAVSREWLKWCNSGWETLLERRPLIGYTGEGQSSVLLVITNHCCFAVCKQEAQQEALRLSRYDLLAFKDTTSFSIWNMKM